MSAFDFAISLAREVLGLWNLFRIPVRLTSPGSISVFQNVSVCLLSFSVWF